MVRSVSRRGGLWLSGSCCVLGLVWLACSQAAAAEVPAAEESDAVFGLTRVWKIHLRVSAENWKSMQPTGGGMPAFGPPGAPPPGLRPDAPSRNGPPSGPLNPPGALGGPLGPNRPAGPGGPGFRPGSFGYEFDYVKADIELDGQILRDVGLRFKGNGTYMMSASGRKRPFKVDFNRFVDDQRFHGLQQLNLHNNVMDPTQVRQAISYPVFQTAGVPSPRTSFAEVFLTIDGESDRERLGLYTVVEEVDKAFLRRHFKTSKGMLLKPEGTQGLEYKGEDWAAYEWYEPKSKPKKSESQRLIDGLRLIHQADDDQFRREIGNYLEIDEFARFLAANTLLSNMDSFLTHVHNYYLYLPPSTNKFVVLPWDMDLSMGAFFMAGSAEQLQDLSISHPHVGANKLLDRLLEWDEFNGIYREHLRRLTETCFGEQGETLKNLALVRVAIKDQVDADLKSAARTPTSFGPPGGMFGGAPALEVFFTKRRESILSQLAGKSKGQAPGMSFGPRPGQGPGGPPGGPGGFGPGNFHGPQIVRAADKNQDQKLTRVEFLELAATWQKAWDKDKNDSLSSDEIVAGMNESLGPPANAAFKPPAGFGPGNFMGPSLLKLASTDQDDALSNREWVGLFGKWFQEWDMDQDENLVETEVVAGFNKAFAPPPGIRPPGFGPPPPGSGPAVPSAPDTPRRP